MSKQQYDVAAITINGSEVIWVDGPYDAENADAVIKMAVMRQGVEDRFFAACKPKQYKAGDKWTGGVQLELPPEDPDYINVGGMRYPRGPRGLQPGER